LIDWKDLVWFKTPEDHASTGSATYFDRLSNLLLNASRFGFKNLKMIRWNFVLMLFLGG